MPPDSGSVTHWLGALRGGDLDASQPLWERYFARLVGLARARLRTSRSPGAAEDEEDAALSAFDSFCRAATHGRFPRLDDRDDLWRILVAITERKATDQVRRARRQKRGGGRVHSEGELAAGSSYDQPAGFDAIAGPEPTPEFVAEFAEEYRSLFEVLRDKDLRRIAVWKLEGHTVDEIAAKLGCARRTVARRLELIRTLWRARAPVGNVRGEGGATRDDSPGGASF
jgi:DNA-directed RNA polymerase specialized sigma24 family protein